MRTIDGETIITWPDDIDAFCAQLRAELSLHYFASFANVPRGPDGEHHPSRRILLALAWMQELTSYWQAQYDSWPPEQQRIADVAKRMCRAAGSDPDEIVHGNPAPLALVKMFSGQMVAHVPNIIGTATPLWVRHMQSATDAIKLVGGDTPAAAEEKAVPLPPLPALVVER